MRSDIIKLAAFLANFAVALAVKCHVCSYEKTGDMELGCRKCLNSKGHCHFTYNCPDTNYCSHYRLTVYQNGDKISEKVTRGCGPATGTPQPSCTGEQEHSQLCYDDNTYKEEFNGICKGDNCNHGNRPDNHWSVVAMAAAAVIAMIRC